MNYYQLIDFIYNNNCLPSKDQIQNNINIFDKDQNNILIYIIENTNYEIPDILQYIINVNITNIEYMNIPMLYITHRHKIPPIWMFDNLDWNHLDMANHNIQMIYVLFCDTILPNFMIKNISNINHQNCKGETLPIICLKYCKPYIGKYLIEKFCKIFKIDYTLHDDNMETLINHYTNINLQ